jgi:hypothetical protein
VPDDFIAASRIARVVHAVGHRNIVKVERAHTLEGQATLIPYWLGLEQRR